VVSLRGESGPRGRGAPAVGRRVLTAAIALPVVLLVAWGGAVAVGCLAAVAAAVAGWELAGMAGQPGERRRNIGLTLWPAALVAVTTARASGAWSGSWWPVALAFAAGAVLAAGWFAAMPPRGSPAWRPALAVLAGAYFGLLLAHAPALRAGTEGLSWLLVALLTTFAADTAAYFTGTTLGRHRLMPRISPGKTWEGAAGGVTGGIAAAVALLAILDPGPPLWTGVLLGLAVAVAGTAGDLVESALKRSVGLKDSGTLLPGHGGILDRLDSLAPNLAVVYWFAVWAPT